MVVPVGTAMTDAHGGIKAVTSRPLGASDEKLYYRLMPGTSGDWSSNDWVYLTSEQSRVEDSAPSVFFFGGGESSSRRRDLERTLDFDLRRSTSFL